MNLKQIQQDFANNIIVSRETLVKAIDYAIELEKKNQRTLSNSEVDDMVFGYAPSCQIGEGRILVRLAESILRGE